jgi:AAA family ATP:ADP antiporter
VEREQAIESTAAPSGGKATRVFQVVRQSRHLSLLATLLLLGVVVEAFVDYEFKVTVTEAFMVKDQLTAFLGTVATCIGFLSLFIQLFLTSRILKHAGVGPAIMALPAGLLGASIVLAIKPTLLAAAALQVIDGALSYSVHRSSMELLYLPVAADIRNTMKTFIDTFVDRFGRAIGGLLLLLLTAVFSLTVPTLSLVACCFLVAWIGAALMVKQEYLHSFRLALEKKTIEPDALHSQSIDSTTTRTLLDALLSQDERQVLYALDLLSNTPPSAWRRYQSHLIQHPSSSVRARSIALLTQWDDRTAPQINKLLHDPDLGVRAEAVHYLYRKDPQPAARLMEFLNHSDHAIVQATVHCMSRYRLVGVSPMNERLVEGTLKAKGERNIAARIAAASAINLVWTGSALVRRYLDRLLRDSSPEVARQAIQTTANVRYDGAIPVLIGMLADSRLRADAREALLRFGDDIFPELARQLLDDAVPMAVRARIPKVLAYSGKQTAADILTASLHQAPANLDIPVMKALNRMRLQFPDVVFQRQAVLDLISRERDDYLQLQAMSFWIRTNVLESGKPHDAGDVDDVLHLLLKTMSEKAAEKLGKIFRLLALSYPPHDIYSAYYTCVSKPSLRASAVEFLDNLLDTEFTQLLIPLMEEPASSERLRARHQGPRYTTLKGILLALSRGSDPWLQLIAEDLTGRIRSVGSRRTRSR